MVVMKRIIAAILLTLILFTGCEFIYPEAEGDIYLLSVALSYRGSDISPVLNATLPDQKAMRGQLELLSVKSGKYFRETAIIQDNDIRTEGNLDLSLKGGDVKTLISEAIEKIGSVIAENDILIFYYSGHGYADGALAFSGTSTMAPDELLEEIKTLDCRKLLILDCCYSGNYVKGGSSSFIEAYRSIFSSNDDYDNNLWVMAAALPYQKSWEEQGGHGFFTEAILKVTGYDLDNEVPAVNTGRTISFLTLTSEVPSNIRARLGKDTGYMEQYPNSTLTGRDLVLFRL